MCRTVLFEKTRKVPDQFLRCILTLKCYAGCTYCSALISEVSDTAANLNLAPEIWAEGINKRKLPIVITGGEPFLYRRLPELVTMLDPKIHVRINTNLQHSVEHYISKVRRPVSFIASLHTSTNFDQWYARLRQLLEYNPVQLNVVGVADWISISKFLLRQPGLDIFTISKDQRDLPKSLGAESNQKYPEVTCSSKAYQYGPDGYRYACIKLMGLNTKYGRFEHISEPMTDQWVTVTECPHFGYCAACSNLVEGVVTYP